MRQLNSIFPLIVTALFIFLLGCKITDEEYQSIKGQIDNAGSTLSNYTQSGKETASDEVEKLFIFEYEVFEYDLDMASSEQTEALTALGKERWECFHVQPTTESLRFYCKRRPRTYLRLIPRVF